MFVRIIILAVVSCLLVGADARNIRPGHGRPHRIPPRCWKNSVTPVRCDQPLSEDSLLPHPNDCQLFYVCEQSFLPPVCRQCPANLHFNPISHVCDWPSAANCTAVRPTRPTYTTSITEASNETETTTWAEETSTSTTESEATSSIELSSTREAITRIAV